MRDDRGMTIHNKRAGLLLILACTLLAGAPATATTYVPMTDEALVEQAPVIALVTAQGSGPGSGNGWPATVYRMHIERILKGVPGSREITVQVPGGVRPEDGIGFRIWGAPRFAQGERALLFLSPRSDGTYAIVDLMLGAFHEVPAGGSRLAVRKLSGARPVARPGEALPAEPLRDFDRFTRWIVARAQGLGNRPDYEVPADPALRQIVDRFTVLQDPDDLLNMRWFVFAAGQSVAWRAHQDGQPGLAGGGFTEFQTAIAAWNNDPGSKILYTYAGTTTSLNGVEVEDTVNSIVFEQSLQDLGIAPFSCFNGGVLAVGGPWYEAPATEDFRGTPFHRTVSADIATNQGVSCFFQNSQNGSKGAEELFAHELGHTLALGHSNQNQALMFAFIHDDARGAQLHADDRAGAAFLYPPGTNLFTLVLCRLLDTRNPAGPYGGPSISSGQSRAVQAAGQCGIPTTAVALSVNVTVVNASAPGWLTIYPADQAVPATTAINFGTQQTRANNGIVLLSATGTTFRVRPTLASAGSVHVIVDVNGYFE